MKAVFLPAFLASIIAMTAVTSTASADEVATPTAAPPAVASAAVVAAPVAPPTPLTTLPTRPSKPLTFAPQNESTPWGYKLIAGVGIAAAAALWIRNKRRGDKGPKTKRSRIDVMGKQSVGMRSELLVVDVEGMRLLIGMTPSSMQTLAVLDTPPEPAHANESMRDENPDPLMDALPSSRRDVVNVSHRRAEEPKLSTFELAARAVRRRSPAASTAPAPFETNDENDKNEEDSQETVDVLGDRVRSLLAARATSPQNKPTRKPRSKRVSTNNNNSAPATTPKTTLVAGQAKGLLLALEQPTNNSANAKNEDEQPEPIRLGDW